MNILRSYRFPPLDVLQLERAPEAGEPTVPVDSAVDADALAQAYEQAMQRGHAQGLAQGQQDGLQTGRSAGFVQGMQEAQAHAQQAAQVHLQRLAAPIDALQAQLQGLHADWQASLRKDVIDLVERVARQVVRCELTLQPAQILSLVEETLSGMPQRTGAVEVFLHPADLQRIQELDATRLPAWNLLADSALEAGECRLRVGDEEADAGCKQRLAACMEQVKEQLLSQETV